MMFGQTDRDPMTTSLTLTSLIQNHHYHHHILRTEPGCNNMQITAALHSAERPGTTSISAMSKVYTRYIWLSEHSIAMSSMIEYNGPVRYKNQNAGRHHGSPAQVPPHRFVADLLQIFDLLHNLL